MAPAEDGRERRARDPEGRPRQDRPRDRLGRPLPFGADGVEPVPDEIHLPTDELIDYAQRLLDEGRPFGAHEVLEAQWKAVADGPLDAERGLWRALAQLAVGVTHLERGNLRGARELCLRAVDGLRPWRAAGPYGLAVAALADAGERIVDEIDAGRPPSVPVLRLRA